VTREVFFFKRELVRDKKLPITDVRLVTRFVIPVNQELMEIGLRSIGVIEYHEVRFLSQRTFLLSYHSRSISHYGAIMDGPVPVYLCVQCRPFIICTASMMDGPDLQLSPINIEIEFASLVLNTLLSRTYRITRASTSQIPSTLTQSLAMFSQHYMSLEKCSIL